MVDAFAEEPNFYSHREHLLMGSTWSYGIREVSQKFEGGPIEFRNALWKYAIEVGFQFKYLKNDKVRVTIVYKF